MGAHDATRSSATHDPAAERGAGDPGPDVAQLMEEVRALRSEVASLHARLDDGPPTPARSPASVLPARSGTVGPTHDRRAVLRKAGAAAAGAVAGGAALALSQSGPAAAADGDFLTLGEVRISASETELRYGGGTLVGDHILLVQDSSNSAASSFGAAVAGVSINGRIMNGVFGHTQNPGAGVVGSASGSESISGHFIAGTGAKANLRIGTSGPVPQLRNSNGSYLAGDVVGDAQDDLWLCVGSGATGSTADWRKLGGPATAGQLHILPATVRCYDSRPGNPPLVGNKTPLGGGIDRVVDVKLNGSGVPSDAVAVLVNVTVTNTSANGFLALFKGDIAWPGTSTLNWDHANTNVANSAVVALGFGASIKARVGAGAQTDVIVDVVGYYR